MFLAWRLRGSNEGPTVAAVRAAGGQVFFTYQSPSQSTFYYSVAMLPGYTYLSQVQTEVDPSATPATPTISERILGSGTDHTVACVEIKLDQLTPEMADRLKSLRHLRTIVLLMPVGMVPEDSAEGRRLAELQAEFPGILYPAYNPVGF